MSDPEEMYGDDSPVARPAKKSRFHDDIAADDDDPDADDEDLDEEDDDDLMDTVDNKVVIDEDDDALHMAVDQERERKENADLFEQIQSRYGEAGALLDERLEQQDGEYFYDEQQAAKRLPTIKDPKLFLVKCDPGKEQEMIIELMQRVYKREHSSDGRLHICSAFATPASKGYIYVEAYREAHVKTAIENLRSLKWYHVHLVPIKEMVQAVTITASVSQIQTGDWVRMKRGTYKDDLAQVVSTQDQGTVVTIKLIPRIDIAQLEREHSGQTPVKTGRGKRKRTAVRPLPRLFDVQQIEALGGIVDRRARGIKVYKGDKYKHGYLIKTVKIAGVNTDIPLPTADEVEKFQAKLGYESDDSEGSDQDVADMKKVMARMKRRRKKKVQFYKDDRVIVIRGDLKNLQGRVVSVYQNAVKIRVDSTAITKPLEFTMEDLAKFFKIGDHVKVLEGDYKGETGIIIRVDEADRKCTVISDGGARDMQVDTAHIIESTEISTGRESLGEYNLYDLVQLNQDMVGIIVKVEVNSFKLLTSRGVIQSARLQELGKKKTSRFAATMDIASNQLLADDVVRVLKGPHAGKQGTIKHIYRSAIFLHSRTVHSNSGVFMVRGQQCRLVGQRGKTSMQAQSPSANGGDFKRGGNNRFKTNRRQKDPLVGQIVIITGGPWKTHRGRCLDANEIQVRVELNAIAKKVSVPRHMIREQESVQHTMQYEAQTPLIGGATPGWSGGRTPHHGESGMTPAWQGARTPGRTPSRDPDFDEHDDVWNPRTPHRPSSPSNVPATPHESDLESMLEQGLDSVATPYTPHTPATPYEGGPDDYSTPHTPYGGYTPHTPATPSAQTPHHETPHSPMTPGMGLGDDPYDDIAEAAAEIDGDKFQVHCHVMVDGKEAIILEAGDQKAAFEVKFLDSNETRSVDIDSMQPAPIQKEDTVLITAGPYAGQYARQFGIDANTDVGIFKLAGSDDHEMMSMSKVCKATMPA